MTVPVPERVSRADFEATAWQHAPRLASPDPRERIAALDAVMAAFDGAVRTRRRRLVAVDVRTEAEAVRVAAGERFGDGPDVTAERRGVLAAALDGAA